METAEKAIESKKNLVFVDIDVVIKGNKDNYSAFEAKVKHTSPLLRASILRAYGDAIDDMAKLLDRAKVK